MAEIDWQIRDTRIAESKHRSRETVFGQLERIAAIIRLLMATDDAGEGKPIETNDMNEIDTRSG